MRGKIRAADGIDGYTRRLAVPNGHLKGSLPLGLDHRRQHSTVVLPMQLGDKK